MERKATPDSLINKSELISKVAEGNERAFTELFYHYYRNLGKFAYRITKSQELTEEVVQSAFIKIWLKREKLRSVDSLDKYLAVVVRNEALTALKKIAAERISSLKVEKFLMEESAIDLLDNPAEKYQQLIADAISKLPEQQRKVYKMSRYDKLKYQEIADQLGLSPTTVKKHIQLAVAFIRENISARKDFSIALVLTTFIFR